MEFVLALLSGSRFFEAELKNLGPTRSFSEVAGIDERQVNVVYALRVLQAFYFRTYIDEKGHKRFESVDHWVQTRASQFFDKEIQNIILDEASGVLVGLKTLHKQLTMLNPFFVGLKLFRTPVVICS